MASATVASPPSSNATASSSSSSTAASHGLALPSNLPVPTDDGGAIHLVGHPLPACAPLQVVHPTSPPSTEEPEEDTPGQVDLFMRSITRPERDILVFVYPHTGKPNAPPGNGWDDVPGARGCTPELVAVQEGWAALQEQQARKGGKGREVQVYAMSGDEGEWQGEVSKRLGLGFPLLSCHSPSSHPFSTGLSLPTFEHQGSTYLKRVTLLIREGQVVRTDYPVFPPDEAWSRIEKQGWFKEEDEA